MGKKKLSDERVAALRADYEAWNPFEPGSETADELAARHGISKQTLYNYREEWMKDSGRHQPTESDLRETVTFLTGELVRARARIAALEGESLHDKSPG